MLTLSDEGFKKYGKKIDIDVEEIVSYLDNLTLPLQGNKYVASDEKFEELLQLKASDGMKFYHMLGKDMNTYLIPVFSGLPNLSKQDKLDIYLYDLQNAYLLVDMRIFKKKLNREISVSYRILKLN